MKPRHARLPREARPGWLKRMDQRSRTARALHERLAAVGGDLGGLDNLTAIERSVLERFLHTEALAAQIEEQARGGLPFDVSQYLAITDRVLRLGSALGLSRRERPVRRLADIIGEARP